MVTSTDHSCRDHYPRSGDTRPLQYDLPDIKFLSRYLRYVLCLISLAVESRSQVSFSFFLFFFSIRTDGLDSLWPLAWLYIGKLANIHLFCWGHCSKFSCKEFCNFLDLIVSKRTRLLTFAAAYYMKKIFYLFLSLLCFPQEHFAHSVRVRADPRDRKRAWPGFAALHPARLSGCSLSRVRWLATHFSCEAAGVAAWSSDY